MIDNYDLYCRFKQAESVVKKKKYKKPDEKVLEKRVSADNKWYVEQIRIRFLTVWQNIDPYTYFYIGFKTKKSFTFKNFFDRNVLERYIAYDKSKKRKDLPDKRSIIKSFEFIKNSHNISLKEYCSITSNGTPIIFLDYIKNNIDIFLVIYCILYKYIVVTEDIEILIPYIHKRTGDLILKLTPFIDFMHIQENGKI